MEGAASKPASKQASKCTDYTGTCNGTVRPALISNFVAFSEDSLHVSCTLLWMSWLVLAVLGINQTKVTFVAIAPFKIADAAPEDETLDWHTLLKKFVYLSQGRVVPIDSTNVVQPVFHSLGLFLAQSQASLSDSNSFGAPEVVHLMEAFDRRNVDVSTIVDNLHQRSRLPLTLIDGTIRGIVPVTASLVPESLAVDVFFWVLETRRPVLILPGACAINMFDECRRVRVKVYEIVRVLEAG